MSEAITLTLSDVRAVWVSTVAFDDEREAYGEAFDKLMRKIQADAIRDVATGFIDWDILYGHEPETEDYREAMKNVAYLERMADRLECRGVYAGL